jgi:hypothetical protein
VIFPVLLLLVMNGLVFFGCVAQRTGLEIPSAARVVGGGRSIVFEAPSDGILYLVNDRKLVLSRTVRKGDRFNAEGQVLIGAREMVELIDARLYFLPEELDDNALPIERGAGIEDLDEALDR